MTKCAVLVQVLSASLLIAHHCSVSDTFSGCIYIYIYIYHKKGVYASPHAYKWTDKCAVQWIIFCCSLCPLNLTDIVHALPYWLIHPITAKPCLRAPQRQRTLCVHLLHLCICFCAPAEILHGTQSKNPRPPISIYIVSSVPWALPSKQQNTDSTTVSMPRAAHTNPWAMSVTIPTLTLRLTLVRWGCKVCPEEK